MLGSNCPNDVGVEGHYRLWSSWLFCLIVVSRMLWWRSYMSSSIHFDKHSKLRWEELRFVSSHQLFWNSTRCKQGSQHNNCSGCWGLWHPQHFRPLGVCIHCNEEWFSIEGASKVDMDPVPWLVWPNPWVQGYSGRCLIHQQTISGWFSNGFQVLIQTRPPYMTVPVTSSVKYLGF